MAEEKLIRNPKLIIGEAEKVEAEVVGADDIVVVTDEEFYTSKQIDELLKKCGANLPILTSIWSDHIINDMSWLRADTFSWQSGDVYVAAYEHLAEEFASVSEWSYETVGGVYIGYKLMPDGHKITDATSEQYVQAIYEATGVAWYYILDTENKQFKLPRSKHNKYADTVPVVGTGKSIGFTPVNKAFSGNNALYPNEGAIGTTKTVYQANTAAGLGLSTDPSLSQVFAQQAQDTDQYKYLYFYVGNFEQSAVEQTAGLNAELFNNKADVGFGNVSNAAKELMANSSMPSDTYINLTLGASGSTYTAPADGWVSLNKRTSATNQYALLNNKNSNICVRCAQSTSGVAMCVYIPVKTGDVFTAEYSAGGDTNWFCFIYAEGAKHLA